MRARNIKPGFFRNEQLMQVAPLGRLLFAGLWCLADREGRLLDRPNQIKWDVLPADDCDADALLDDLARRGFIRRYSVDGTRYILVTGFRRNQSPHHREKASILPPPPDTAPAQKQPSAALIPDSLIPDSLIPESSQPKLSKYDLPLKLEDYRPPTETDESLSHIAACWQSLTGETVSLTDRQHIRQALTRGLSEQAIIDLITALGSTAQAKPLRLSTILAAQLAKSALENTMHDDQPTADEPAPTEKPRLPSANKPALTEKPRPTASHTPPTADKPTPAEMHTRPDAVTPPSTEKMPPALAAPEPPNFFAPKDGNPRKTQAHKPTKPSINWHEAFFSR